MDQITEYLWLGNAIAANNKIALKWRGVTHILTTASGRRPKFPDEFKYECFNVIDLPTANII